MFLLYNQQSGWWCLILCFRNSWLSLGERCIWQSLHHQQETFINSLYIFLVCSVEIIRDKMLPRCLRKFGGIIKPWTKVSNSLELPFIFVFFLSLICSPLLKQLMTHYRVLKDKGVYILVIISPLPLPPSF